MGARSTSGLREAWLIGRRLGLQVAAHISPGRYPPDLGPLDQGRGGDSGTLAARDPTHIVHMTDVRHGLQKVKDVGVAGLARRPDRDEYAARPCRHPQLESSDIRAS